jgi:site-specific DNA-methyltransferase (adenine-specific)
MPDVTLLAGDCLDLLPLIDDQSVDLWLSDWPYGTTQAAWDSVLPLDRVWAEVRRILKPRGVVVLTAAQPFTSTLVKSNPAWFRCEWIWRKNRGTGHLNAKKMPLRAHESVLVFAPAAPFYSPQMRPGAPYQRIGCSKHALNKGSYGKTAPAYDTISDGARYPLTVLDFSVVERPRHPNEKPVELGEYCIQTYTHPGAVVLDNCMGSGSFGVAAVQQGRGFIGMELDPTYYAVACDRIRAALPAPVQAALVGVA